MKIIGWFPTASNYYETGSVARSWKPIFALPRPQFIFDPLYAQIIGRVRRIRLCSSGVPLNPYQ